MEVKLSARTLKVTLVAGCAAAACLLALLVANPSVTSGAWAGTAGQSPVGEGAAAQVLSSEQWQQRLEGCAPASAASRESYLNAVVLDCVAAAYMEAAQTGQVSTAAAATEAVITRNPYFAMVCHEGAHNAGKATLDRFAGDVVATFEDFSGSIACEGGFIHGITDAFGKSSPSDEDFKSLVKGCDLPDRGDFYSVCAHGYGHAAWIATQDPLHAAELCVLLPDEHGRGQCGDGVMMDMYYPAGEGIAHRDLSRATTELPKICAEWPHLDVPGMRSGCVRGSAFIFTRPLFEVLEREGGSIPAPYTSFPKEFLANMRAASQVAIDSCFLLPGDMGRDCEEAIVVYLASRPEPMLQEAPLREAVCSGLTRKAIREKCVSMEYTIF